MIKLLNNVTREVIQIQNNHQSIIDAISVVNKFAHHKFEFTKHNSFININDINIDIDSITEIWHGDGWVRIECGSASSITLYEFGKIQVFIF